MSRTPTYGRDLERLREWLAAEDVTHVAMESTGVFWKPVWHVLEGHLELLLVNAKHVKMIPGRKTDVADAAWLAQLLECGLLRGSFIPPPEIRQLRDLTAIASGGWCRAVPGRPTGREGPRHRHHADRGA